MDTCMDENVRQKDFAQTQWEIKSALGSTAGRQTNTSHVERTTMAEISGVTELLNRHETG